MKRVRHIPLFAYLLLMYNAVVFSGAAVREFGLGTVMHTFSLPSGAVFTVSVGESLLMIGAIALYAEMVRATRDTTASLRDHRLPVLICAGFLVEFLLVAKAATLPFFALLLMSLLGVIAGFTVGTVQGRQERTFQEEDLP